MFIAAYVLEIKPDYLTISTLQFGKQRYGRLEKTKESKFKRRRISNRVARLYWNWSTAKF